MSFKISSWICHSQVECYKRRVEILTPIRTHSHAHFPLYVYQLQKILHQNKGSVWVFLMLMAISACNCVVFNIAFGTKWLNLLTGYLNKTRKHNYMYTNVQCIFFGLIAASSQWHYICIDKLNDKYTHRLCSVCKIEEKSRPQTHDKITHGY